MKSAELFEKLKGMPEVVAKIQAECKTQDEVYAALKALGLTDNKEEFFAVVKENIIASGVVSEEELDSALAAGDELSALLAEREEMGARTKLFCMVGVSALKKIKTSK